MKRNNLPIQPMIGSKALDSTRIPLYGPHGGVAAGIYHDGNYDMNLLSTIDWRAVASNRPELFESVNPSSLNILSAIAEGRLLDLDVRSFLQSLGDDPETVQTLDKCGLHVSADTSYWRSATESAPAVNLRPRTWLEAHQLEDNRWLIIPGERVAAPTLSFWRYDPTDGRPGVVSLVADTTGQIAGILVHRSKQCQEDFENTGVCAGRTGGCECESSISIEGSTVIDICDCSKS